MATKTFPLHYFRITREDGDLSSDYDNLWMVLIELDNSGSVMRELGFDQENNLVHKHPSHNFKHGPRGIFDVAFFEVRGRDDDLIWEEFQGLWVKFLER